MTNTIWAELAERTAAGAAKYIIDWNVTVRPTEPADAEAAAREVLRLLIQSGEDYFQQTQFGGIPTRKFGMDVFGSLFGRHIRDFRWKRNWGALRIRDYASRDQLRLDRFPIDIDYLLRTVSQLKKLNIEIREVKTDSHFVSALLQMYGNDRVVLSYPAQQAPELTRFAIAKELIHLLDEPQDIAQRPHEQIEAVVASEQEAILNEMYKNWAALEVLYPAVWRHQDLRQLNKGSISAAALAERYGIPEFLVETGLGSLNFNLERLSRLYYREPQRTWVAKLLTDVLPLSDEKDEAFPTSPDEQYREELMGAAGGLYSTSEVASLLGIPEADVRSLRNANKLLALDIAGAPKYPRAQFDETTKDVVAGVAPVVEALAKQNPWVALEFLITPDSVLGGISPLNALRQGGEMREKVKRQMRISSGDGFA
jgi:hypothetical protein